MRTCASLVHVWLCVRTLGRGLVSRVLRRVLLLLAHNCYRAIKFVQSFREQTTVQYRFCFRVHSFIKSTSVHIRTYLHMRTSTHDHCYVTYEYVNQIYQPRSASHTINTHRGTHSRQPHHFARLLLLLGRALVAKLDRSDCLQ